MSRTGSFGFGFSRAGAKPIQGEIVFSAHIPGVILSVQSDIGITLNSSTVSAWADQSGNHNDYSQATGAKQPAYSATGGPGGLPMLSLTTTSMAADSPLVLPAPGTMPTFICGVILQNAWGTARGIFSGVGTATAFLLQQQGVPPMLQVYNGIGGVNQNANAPLGSWVYFEAYASNSASDYLLLGSAAPVTGGGSAGNNATAGVRIGYPTSGSANASIAMVSYAAGLPSTRSTRSGGDGTLPSLVTSLYGASVKV